MCIQNGPLLDIINHIILTILNRNCDCKGTWVDDNHGLFNLSLIKNSFITEHATSIFLHCNHVHSDMLESDLCNSSVVQIVNFLEARDEEDTQLVLIRLHDVLDEVLLEEGEVSDQFLKGHLIELWARAVLLCFHCCRPLATKQEGNFAEEVTFL